MGFLDLIASLKGRALDLKDIELIKHTYELQEQNSGQLRDRVAALEADLREKEETVGELEASLTSLRTEC